MVKKIEFTKEQKDEIVKFYEKEFLHPLVISDKFGCSTTPIYKVLRERGINTNLSDRFKKLYSNKKLKPHNLIEFKEEEKKEIVRLYEEDLLNNIEIGKKFGVDGGVILRVLNENNVNTSNSHRRKKLFEVGKLKPSIGFTGRHHTDETKKVLREKFTGREVLEETKKKISVGNKCKIRSKEVRERIKNTRIKRINDGDITFSSGEEHHCWLGGSSFEPYDKNFKESFKRKIRKRDNQICISCGIHREKLNRALSVHHINYDKEMSIPENCLSLCLKCNSNINKNRQHWQKFFQSFLSEKYGYQYSEQGDIILNVQTK